MHGGTDAAYRDELVERFHLDTGKKVRALSKGNRQKVQLIAALATRADLLLLDEPTSGLDPLMEMVFREVREAKERGQTVFLSSHILSEVEAVCDRVGILRDGRLVDEGTLGSCATSAPRRSRSRSTAAPDAAGVPGCRSPSAGPNALRFEVTEHRPADRRAGRAAGGRADEPRAVAGGDLPAPLRGRRRRRCAAR